MAKPRTRADRLRALRDGLRRQQMVGPFSLPVVAGLGLGFVASFVADLVLYRFVEVPWRQMIDGVVFAVVAAPVWLRVQRADLRDAIETLTWLNGWETERWQTEIGRRLPSLPRARPELLDALPDTMGLRPLRVELLAIRGADAEAWERLELLPADTAWQRFERAALTEWLLFLTDGPPAIDQMEAAAPDVEDDRSVVARAMVAAARARRLAVDGADPSPPLAAVRGELGDRPGRYAFGYQTGVIVSVISIAVLAGAAVGIAAAVIR